MDDQRLSYRAALTDNSRWDGFTLRVDDIVISTPSKCGTTWMQMICALLVFQTADLPAPLATLSPWLDMWLTPVEEVWRLLDDQTHRRFIKTHTPLDGLRRETGVTYVVVGRDPRDVAVSTDHHRANVKRDVIERVRSRHTAEIEPGDRGGLVNAPMPEPADRRERLLRWIDCDDPPATNLSTLRGTVWHLADAWSRRDEPNVVLFHYADLLRDLEGQMRRLARRLDITVPEHLWPALVEAAKFHSMRSRSAALSPVDLLTDSDRFFRNGSSGQWRGILAEKDLVHYRQRLDSLAPPGLVDWLERG